MFLKKVGFNEVVVGTAEEAINTLRKQKFDLMFLTYNYRTHPEIKCTRQPSR